MKEDWTRGRVRSFVCVCALGDGGSGFPISVPWTPCEAQCLTRPGLNAAIYLPVWCALARLGSDVMFQRVFFVLGRKEHEEQVRVCFPCRFGRKMKDDDDDDDDGVKT